MLLQISYTLGSKSFFFENRNYFKRNAFPDDRVLSHSEHFPAFIFQMGCLSSLFSWYIPSDNNFSFKWCSFSIHEKIGPEHLLFWSCKKLVNRVLEYCLHRGFCKSLEFNVANETLSSFFLMTVLCPFQAQPTSLCDVYFIFKSQHLPKTGNKPLQSHLFYKTSVM